MAEDARMTPTGLRKINDARVAIDWADGLSFEYPVDQLRAACPCASCIDEWSGKVIVRYEDVAGTGFTSITPVGSYAFQVSFSDGHNTGIYTFKRLRRLGEVFSEGGKVDPAENS